MLTREQLEKIFDAADIDRDCFVSEEEILAAAGQYTALLESSLMGGDTNKDQRLSLEEFLKSLEPKQA